LAISKEFEVALRNKVNDWCLSSTGILRGLINTFSGNIEKLVDVDGRCEGSVLQHMKVSHTDLTEVTRVVFIEEGTVVMLSSSITTTTGMLAVLSDTTMSHLDVAALLTSFVEAGRHIESVFYSEEMTSKREIK